MLIKAANESCNGAEVVSGILRLDFAGESDDTVRYIDVSKDGAIYINGVEYELK